MTFVTFFCMERVAYFLIVRPLINVRHLFCNMRATCYKLRHLREQHLHHIVHRDLAQQPSQLFVHGIVELRLDLRHESGDLLLLIVQFAFLDDTVGHRFQERLHLLGVLAQQRRVRRR